MTSHDIDFKVIGEGVQYVDITLDPGETVIAEAGAVIYLEDGVSYEAKMGDGSNPDQSLFGKMFSGAKRMVTGESLFLTHFTNKSNEVKQVGFAGNIPGSTVGVDLSKIGGSITCQRGSFLCAAHGTNIDLVFNKKLGAGFFGGEGFILQKATGNGKFILNCGGKVIKKKLCNESIRVDAGCLVAFTDGIDYDITPAGNLGSMLFGGEGLFFATLSGTGVVLLQSSPISKMANTILGHANSGSKKSGLGDISEIFDK